MRGGRILIIVGVVVLVGALAVGFMLWRNAQSEPTSPEIGEEVGEEVGEGTAVPYTPPEGMMEIVVAAQDTIPRGTYITAESGAVKIATWPEEFVPEGALTDIEKVYGKIARVDILGDTPVLAKMLSPESGALASIGSEAALQIPVGKVAYVLPVSRYSSVAWALQPGDHVDVMISLLLVELDEEFQTILRNQASCVSCPTTGEGEGNVGGMLGRLEALTNGWIVNVRPSEAQRPNLITQLTIQDALVLRVGDWDEAQEVQRVAGGGGEEVAPSEEQSTLEGAQPTPVPEEQTKRSVEPLTLAVTPQDAMVLEYIQQAGAKVDLVLRSASDSGRSFATEPVTLKYLFDKFGIQQPPKLPYGIEPRLETLEGGTTSEPVNEGGETTGEVRE